MFGEARIIIREISDIIEKLKNHYSGKARKSPDSILILACSKDLKTLIVG